MILANRLLSVFGATAAAITYLLRANFGGSNSGAISNGTSVETASSGSVQDGTLTVTDTSTGTVEVLSNRLKMAGTNSWGTTGVASQQMAGKWSIGFLSKFVIRSDTSFAAADIPVMAGTRPSSGVPSGSPFGVAFFLYANTIQYQPGSGNSFEVASATTSTNYKVATILGGYNSTGTPYQSGDTKANFNYGAHAFVHNGSNWMLVFTDKNLGGTDAYFFAQGFTGSVPGQVDDIVLPNVDLSSLLVPTNLDTSVSTGDTRTHVADHFGECKITTLPSSGNLDIVIRQQDSTHEWIIRITSAGAFSLVEDNAGETTRAGPTAGAASNGSVVRWSAIGSTIKVWIDGTSRANYASASNFATETAGTITFGSGTIAHLADWPAGSNGEYADLESY